MNAPTVLPVPPATGAALPPPAIPFPQPPAQPRFAMVDPQPVREADVGPALIHMARAVAAICASRMLLLIATITSSVVWVWTVMDPQHDRIIAASAFSLVAVLPLTLLYARKG